jgi:glutamyl-Q tRNA(Asp) synthetase
MRNYRGRFAPSPTGPLHFGSLVAALGSFCEARSRGGEWLVRMEDLDRPREAPGAADAILRALDQHGFEWSEPVMRQSGRNAAYHGALETLRTRGAVYVCACTRREIADSSVTPGGEPVYPGTCRGGLPPGRTGRATRVRVEREPIAFDDSVMGTLTQDLEREVGDFVLLRADGLIAYQLAVVVDDAEQGITGVVRGADLLGSTARQIHLHRLLGLPTPGYAHLPAAVNAKGEKLSKQTHAAPLDPACAAPALVRALEFLGQSPPPALARATVREVWQWAGANWDLSLVPRQRTKAAS